MRQNKRVTFGKPLRVLVIEDNNVDRRILESMLTESSQPSAFLKIAETLASANQFLQQHPFDVMVLDLNLPDSKGLDTLIQMHQRYPAIPIVVNTGAYEDDLGLTTLSCGAQDFLVKGKYTSDTLKKVLHYAIERKRLESEIKEAYEELKRTQEQLVEAEKMKVIGGLASGIAHEVKNPLATILYGITYLSDNIDFQDKKVDMVLANIKEAVHRASKIITDLLNFSNINKIEKHMENLNQLIDKSLQLTQFQMDKHHIEVIKSFDRTLPKVRVDPNRIEQVLLNLIMNAVAAMPKGGQLAFTTYATQMTAKEKEKDLRLKSNGFKDGQEVVIISLEDTGCGIPQEQINNIFNPFFTTHRSQGGVGLGLTVSRNIMETHGGKIFLENRKKGGARATLIFKV